MHDNPETDTQQYSTGSSQIIIDASRRIYYFPWITERFIGTSVSRAKLWALSYVGAGFKTMTVMILFIFWNVWLALVNKIYDLIYTEITESLD